jgi:hypothetical protein
MTTNNLTEEPQCIICGDDFPLARYNLRYLTCLSCGDVQAHKVKHTVVPMHKGNYVKVTDMNDLKDLNPKYIRSA